MLVDLTLLLEKWYLHVSQTGDSSHVHLALAKEPRQLIKLYQSTARILLMQYIEAAKT